MYQEDVTSSSSSSTEDEDDGSPLTLLSASSPQRRHSSSPSSPHPCSICGESVPRGGLTRHMLEQHRGCGVALDGTFCGGLLSEKSSFCILHSFAASPPSEGFDNCVLI